MSPAALLEANAGSDPSTMIRDQLIALAAAARHVAGVRPGDRHVSIYTAALAKRYGGRPKRWTEQARQ